MLVAEPLVYPLGGASLLAPAAGIGIEVALDDRAVLVHDRLGRLHRRHLRREVVHLQVLVDGVPGNADDVAYSRDLLALPLQLSYSLYFGHADRHPLRPPSSNT